MSQSRLQELRAQVDVINLQILELLNKRATIASEIGKVQQAAAAHVAASGSFGRALDLFQALNIQDKVAAVQALLQAGDEQ